MDHDPCPKHPPSAPMNNHVPQSDAVDSRPDILANHESTPKKSSNRESSSPRRVTQVTPVENWTASIDDEGNAAMEKVIAMETLGVDLGADGEVPTFESRQSTTDILRETWNSKFDFLLSVVGFSVDLANVWRFPYLCYKNGGGAFLIPYFLMLVFGAIPLFFLELALGQYTRRGAIAVWDHVCPLFKGIGFSVVLMAFDVAFYYNTIIGWAFYYLLNSFNWILPWTTCENDWNTDECWEWKWSTNSSITEVTRGNVTVNATTGKLSSHEYYHRHVLSVQESEGFWDLGTPKWQLVLCNFFVFTILYFSLWKGVKSSGKVVWVTATAPYIILLVFFIRGCFLPGAGEGLVYFINPKIHLLANPQVWIDAAVQIFFSVGAGFGVHIALASYNKFDNNCYRDCLGTAAINSATSLFAGSVVFMYLGFMANRSGLPIDKVAEQGPGLVFIVYPEAIATLPGSYVWAVIFFILLITLGLDSGMGGLEAVLTGLMDEFKWMQKVRFGREILTFVVVYSASVMSIMSTTRGGVYVFTLLDTFAAGTSILIAVMFEAIALAWFYGLDQFSSDIQMMLGFKPSIYWRICWKFVTPLFLLTISVASIVTYKPLEYQNYVFPYYANVIGWMMTSITVAIIPGYMVYAFLTTEGSFRLRLAKLLTPRRQRHIIAPDGSNKRFYLQHWLKI